MSLNSKADFKNSKSISDHFFWSGFYSPWMHFTLQALGGIQKQCIPLQVTKERRSCGTPPPLGHSRWSLKPDKHQWFGGWQTHRPLQPISDHFVLNAHTHLSHLQQPFHAFPRTSTPDPRSSGIRKCSGCSGSGGHDQRLQQSQFGQIHGLGLGISHPTHRCDLTLCMDTFSFRGRLGGLSFQPFALVALSCHVVSHGLAPLQPQFFAWGHSEHHGERDNEETVMIIIMLDTHKPLVSWRQSTQGDPTINKKKPQKAKKKFFTISYQSWKTKS